MKRESDGSDSESKLPAKRPLAMGELTREQLEVELLKGMNEMENGRDFSSDDIEAEILI